VCVKHLLELLLEACLRFSVGGLMSSRCCWCCCFRLLAVLANAGGRVH
jgi:hypothetical protein